MSNILRNLSNDMFRRYVAVNETEIYHYTRKSNRQSAERRKTSQSQPQRPKSQQSAGKASLFWYVHGMLCINYFEKAIRSIATVTWPNWCIWEKKLRKKGHVWRRKKCSHTKIMHRITGWENHGKKTQITLRIAFAITALPRFGSHRLLLNRRDVRETGLFCKQR